MSIGEKRLEESPLREWMLQDTVYMEFEDIKKLIFRVEREKQNFSSRILSFRSSILFTSNKKSLRSERFQLSIKEYNLLVFFFLLHQYYIDRSKVKKRNDKSYVSYFYLKPNLVGDYSIEAWNL